MGYYSQKVCLVNDFSNGKIFAGSRNGANVLDLKCSHFVEPQGDQRASIVWLHDKDEHFTE